MDPDLRSDLLEFLQSAREGAYYGDLDGTVHTVVDLAELGTLIARLTPATEDGDL